jgi:integrase
MLRKVMQMTIPKGMFLRKTVWYSRKDVPKPLHGIIGVTSLQRAHTTDFKQSVILHYQAMAEFEQRIVDGWAKLARPPVTPWLQFKIPPRQYEPITLAIESPKQMIIHTRPEGLQRPTGLKPQQVIEKWKLARDPSRSSVNEAERAMQRFITLNGDLVMSAYTVQHARAWRDYIIATDSAFGTKKKTFNAVTILFRYAWKEEIVTTKPFERVSLERPRRARAAKRPGWTLNDLQTWFGSPVYTEGYRPRLGEAAFWIPALGLFMGCRLGELCQADLADIELDGIPRLLIRPSDEDDDEDAKSIKTDESARIVPIHRRLIEAGFLDYVDTLDGTKLFPKVRPDGRGRWSGRFTNWFAAYRRKLGIDQRWTDFHALRHTQKTAANSAGLTEIEHDAITGHTNGSVGRTYIHPSVAKLKEAIDKIDFDVTMPRWTRGS